MALTRRMFLSAAAGSTMAGLAAPSVWARQPQIDRDGRVFSWSRLRGGAMAVASLTSGGNVLVVPFKGAGGQTDPAGLLVDTKFAGIAPVLRSDVAAILGEVPMTLVVNTHHHGDHTGGNLAFKGAQQIVAHENAAPRIAAQTDRYIEQLKSGPMLLGQINPDAPASAALAVDQAAAHAADHRAEDWAPTTPLAMSGATSFELGASEVVLTHYGPGHTDNDVVVHLPDLNIVHTGDLLFNKLHPFIDRSGGASSAGWLAAVGKVTELCDRKTIVVPGHGQIAGVAALRGQAAYFEAVRDAAERAVERGDSRDVFVQTDLPVFAGYGFAQLKERTLGAIYDEFAEGQ